MTLNQAALTVPLLAPLLVALLFAVPKWRPFLIKACPFSAVPAFLLAVCGALFLQAEAPWMLLKSTLALDATAKVFLFFTSLVWGLSGVYAVSYLPDGANKYKFFLSYLLAMCGNIGLILSQDIISFYFYFGLMSFASYGMIVHDRTPFAYFAGLIYLSAVVLGEILIFSGMVITADGVANLSFQSFTTIVSNSPNAPVIIALILFGFGIKAGALPLHVWLPLAHPAAPTAASAILSGAMIKAGLLGWLRFLPLGEASFSEWGLGIMILGLFAAYYAVIVGLAQDAAKAVLAYSSISQIGLMTAAMGAGLAVPSIWPYLWTAIMIFATHHAIAKGSLFLSLGVATGKRKALWVAAFLLPAISLVGAPFTSGALAKASLKWAFKQELASGPWFESALFLIETSAIGTFLLLARFCWLARKSYPERKVSRKKGIIIPWGMLVISSLLLPLFTLVLELALSREISIVNVALADLLPLAIGGGIVVVVLITGWQVPFKIPQGDLLVVYMAVGRAFLSSSHRIIYTVRKLKIRVLQQVLKLPAFDWSPIESAEHFLGIWKVFGMAFLSLTVLLLLLFSIT